MSRRKTETTIKCGECGEETATGLSDCFECADIVDACESCIQDHMAEQHDDYEDDDD